MVVSKVIRYVTLPFRMVWLVLYNCVMTTLSITPMIREVMHEHFLKKTDVKKGSPYIDFVKDGAADYRYFWERTKLFLFMTMEERLAAAQRMLDLEPLECPVLVDLLTDETSKTYGSVPERLYIVQDGVIVYKGGQGPNNYKLAEVEEWLEKYKGQ
ncbi:type I iodothyronine deiodinase-like isoform X1 [Homarus americanus]|uniref:type I iodothyronine deiodinase-like isoform X1 n=1 Tax=Homarus americanus TaxID=6706 RepID=UPI001C47BE4C|nr:type I iodothyronine deiodinase-like isoform X1 [Homarus americanus]